MRYYLKRCGHQELGSVRDGKAQRGRYLLTSKSALDFFPPLSTTQLNDSALLPIFPLYSGKKVYCSFVYHNDKFHGSTAAHPRDEYRIYLNNQLENNSLFFQVDDIIIIRGEEITEDDETQRVLLLDVVQDKQSSLYKQLNTIIDESLIKGGYGIIEDGEITEFENRVNNLRGISEAPVLIDDTVTRQIESLTVDTIAGLFNSVTFRDFVMAGYESLCAVTGKVIRYESLINLEAAHIKPKSHGGLYMPNNGIALSRDIHWAFDKGFFTLTNDYYISVHPQTESEWLFAFDGEKIRLPDNPFFRPAIENVEYHRSNIYGLFLTSGRL